MIFSVYKPKGPTSNKLLNKIRKLANTKKVGHAGTLDPLASGVLVVAIGRESTKQLDVIVQSEKEYLAKVRLGQTSTTEDEEGEKSDIEVDAIPTQEDVQNALAQFVGEIMQVPSVYSAIKINGKEAYKLARKGEQVEMKARPATIKEIELISYEWPYVSMRVVTGKGVYIRSLARDLGEKLATGAYLAELERTRVGQFLKEESVNEADLEAYVKQNYHKPE